MNDKVSGEAVDSPLDEKTFPQTARFQKWVEKERANGLVDIKFFVQRSDNSTVESFCGEVNQMLESPVVPDADLI